MTSPGPAPAATRILAIDLGSKRVGLAISDEAATIAQPHGSLPAQPWSALPDRLFQAAREVAAGEFVVGLPRRLDGSLGPEALAARELATKLRELTGLRVWLVDERLSTVAANRALIAAGVRRERRRGSTDQVAAALILQNYLQQRVRDGR